MGDRAGDVEVPRDENVSPASNSCYFALDFQDGLAASDFAAALINFLSSAEGESYTVGPGRAEVWLSSPLKRGRDGMQCCIYANESAMRAADRAGLKIRRTDRVESGALPARRVLLIGDAG